MSCAWGGIRRVLGYMPQQQNLYDSFTGRRFLLYIAALKEIPRSDAALQVQRVAELVHLSSELENVWQPIPAA